RELAHLQGIFDDRRVLAEAGRLQAAADGYDLTIQRRGKALVEAQLLLAEVLAAGQFGKVEEAEVHRLLDLVGVGASEQKPGNVGFNDLKTLHGVGVEGRILQGGDQGLAHGSILTFRQEKPALWRERRPAGNSKAFFHVCARSLPSVGSVSGFVKTSPPAAP